MRCLITVAATCLLYIAASWQPASAMRCDRRIVSEQDSMFDVLARCGDPTLRDRHPPLNAYGQGYFGYPEETWYYNFGPNRLLHVLQFRNKRLTRIKTDGYGFQMPEDSHCLPNNIHRGMSKLRLLVECGEPNQQEHYYQLVPHIRHGYIAGHTGVLREIWLYNFGPRRLLHEVILEDGLVTDIKARTDHGY